jgi:hypothetical protein
MRSLHFFLSIFSIQRVVWRNAEERKATVSCLLAGFNQCVCTKRRVRKECLEGTAFSRTVNSFDKTFQQVGSIFKFTTNCVFECIRAFEIHKVLAMDAILRKKKKEKILRKEIPPLL